MQKPFNKESQVMLITPGFHCNVRLPQYDHFKPTNIYVAHFLSCFWKNQETLYIFNIVHFPGPSRLCVSLQATIPIYITAHWIREVPIVLYFVLQKILTHVKEVVWNGPAFCNCSAQRFEEEKDIELTIKTLNCISWVRSPPYVTFPSPCV